MTQDNINFAALDCSDGLEKGRTYQESYYKKLSKCVRKVKYSNIDLLYPFQD